VPIIKWQKWEQRALLELSAPVIERVLPCLEIRDSSQHKTLLKSLGTVWPYPVMVDYANPDGILTPPRIKELREFCRQHPNAAQNVIPVINPGDVAVLGKPKLMALLHGHRQVAYRLRVDRYASMDGAIAALEGALKDMPAPSDGALLIIDLGVTPVAWPGNTVKDLGSHVTYCAGLGFVSVHLASGSFPESLASIASSGAVQRRDWQLWEALAAAIPETNVGFSDYGTLWPRWSEAVLMRRGGKATIRYACTDEWLILKGNSMQKAESIAISKLMTTVYAPKFEGKSFSFGDRLIADRADPAVPDKNKLCGQAHIAEGWTHHITFVVKKQY
jgi:hypothetical protein